MKGDTAKFALSSKVKKNSPYAYNLKLSNLSIHIGIGIQPLLFDWQTFINCFLCYLNVGLIRERRKGGSALQTTCILMSHERLS